MNVKESRTSAALKNTLDYFLEEYYNPPAIVSYPAGPFGGILADNPLHQILAGMDAPVIPSPFSISKVSKVFDDMVIF